MGDNELKVDEPPKDKKKRKSTVKKSDLPKEPAEPTADPAETPKETEKPKKKKSEKSEKSASRKQSAVPPPEDVAGTPEIRKESLQPEASDEPVTASADADAAPASDLAPASVPAPAPAPAEDVPAPRRESVQQVEKTVERQNSTTPKRRQSEVNRNKKEKFLEDLDEEKLIELKECFELFDLNGDGFIDLADLKLTFASLGRTEVSDEELMNMLAEASNPLDFDSFVMLLGFKTIALDPEETLRSALSSWDYKDSGLISEERIKHDLMTWGDKFNKAEAEGAFEDAPTFMTNGQAMIDYIKFCKTLGGLRKKS